MIKKILITMLLTVGTVVSACWFTTSNYDRCYIAKINTTTTFYAIDFDHITCTPAGTQDLPCQVWVQLQPRSETNSPAIHRALLQYRKLPLGTWTTFKELHNVAWTINFVEPVELFSTNIFDPPSAVTGDEYLIRLWFTDEIYENADLAEDPEATGSGTWKNQWITKIVIGKRRPL